MAPSETPQDAHRLKAALRLVLQRYLAQVRARPAIAIPALLLPGVAEVLVLYTPPLIIARLLGAFARDERLSVSEMMPYILTLGGCWLAGETIWRVTGLLMTRAEIRGMEALYVEALDELLAKDMAFFQNNFAGSLTKRALGYARRFEDLFDVLCFSVSARVLPLFFAGAVLWSYSPLLMLLLAGMLLLTLVIVFPLIRRRQQLVNVRETASNVLAGHVADSIANAEAVRAFAREREEARIHSANVLDYGCKTQRSWDYQNLRVDTITTPLHVLTNTLGLVLALATSEGTGASLERRC